MNNEGANVMATIALPVSIQTKVFHEENTQIYYPQVYGLNNPNVEQRINRSIVELVNALIKLQYDEQQVSEFEQMIGTYEIKANERNILSLTLSNYAYAPYHAHGLTFMKSLTFDVRTGRNYSLVELFRPNNNYIQVLSREVQNQIEERQIDVFDNGGFTKISPNQDFYVTDQVLVLYFQPYEITPGYVGFPLFPIPIYKLVDIIDENGPLGALLGN